MKPTPAAVRKPKPKDPTDAWATALATGIIGPAVAVYGCARPLAYAGFMGYGEQTITLLDHGGLIPLTLLFVGAILACIRLYIPAAITSGAALLTVLLMVSNLNAQLDQSLFLGLSASDMGMASLGDGAWITPAGMTVTAAGAAYAAIRRHVARKAVRTAWAGGTVPPPVPMPPRAGR